MTLNDFHSILFNAHILYSVALGLWSASVAARGGSISGNFWGAVITSALLAAGVLLMGIIMALQGLQVERTTIYFLYMAWLVVIMPGLFSLLRGRDDQHAALAFAMLSFFNVFVSLSMIQRGLIGPWLTPA
jgi:hypothetical protein